MGTTDQGSEDGKGPDRFAQGNKTKSDTEVIVHAYEQWGRIGEGRICVKRFNRMFALRMRCEEARAVYCGIASRHQAAFTTCASAISCYSVPEIKDASATSGLSSRKWTKKRSPNCSRFATPSPKTLFKGIFKLPSAHSMLASPAGLKSNMNWVGAEANARTSVKRRSSKNNRCLRTRSNYSFCDMPLGFFSSVPGGLRSLLAIMSKYYSGPVQAFTIGFEGGEQTNKSGRWNACQNAGTFQDALPG